MRSIALSLLFVSGASLAQSATPASPPSEKPQRLIFSLGSHIPQPVGVSIVHTASCGSTDYRLSVAPKAQTVILSTSGRPDVDLSATALGARLLDKDVLARVGFNCPMDALNIFITGIKLVDLGAPKGFTGHLSVRSDGTVRQSAEKAEHVDEMATPAESMRVLPSRPPSE